ncbi:MAG: WD40 repeat domain-containing protein [Spirochaetia bacterium]|nr:WD40 repeat domain-containing protein [Spirochaetia bacterium]
MKRAVIIALATLYNCTLFASIDLYRDLTGAHTVSISCVDFSARGDYMVSADLSGTVIIWDVKRGAGLLRIQHGSPVESAALSPDSRFVATGGRDGTVKLWQVVGGGLLKSFEVGGDAVFSVSFSPDSKLLAAGTHKKIMIFSVEQQKKLFDLGTGDAWARCVRFSADGKYLAAGCGTTAFIWEINRKNMINKFLGKDGVSFRQIRSFDHGFNIYAVAITRDSQFLACAGDNGLIKIFRAGDGFLVNAFTDAHAGIIWSLSFSKDGSLLASAGADATVRLWDMKRQKTAGIIAGGEDEIYSVSYCQSSGLLAYGSRDMKLKVWNAGGAGGNQIAGKVIIAGIVAFMALGIGAIALFACRKERAKVKYWKP